MASSSNTELVLAHAESLVAQAASNSRMAISYFCDRFDSAVKQFLSLAKLVSLGYKPVFSLDLCELMDSAISFNEHKSKAGKRYDSLLQRRVLSDIAFSRSAVRSISTGHIPFTILPGTAAEILLFLRRAYSQNGRLIASLRAERLDLLEAKEAKDPSSFALRRHTYKSFESLLRGGTHGVVMMDNLIRYTTTLLQNQGFISPLLFGEAFAVQKDELNKLLQALQSIRPDASELNNFADAVNLAVAGNVRNNPERREVVVHMTRTPSLHKLSRRAGIELDLMISWQGRELEFPLLCRPAVVCLFSTFSPEGRIPENLYAMAERFYRYWAEVSSHLREYEVAVIKASGSSDLSRILSQLERVRQGSEFGDIFDHYLGLFMESSVEGDQLLVENLAATVGEFGLQREELIEHNLEREALAQQKKLQRLFGVLRERTGISRAMRISLSSDLPGGALNALTLAEEAGFFIWERHLGGDEDLREFVIVAEAEGRSQFDLASIFVGLQEYQRHSRRGGTFFWPTTKTIQEFLEVVCPLLVQRGDTHGVLAVAQAESGTLECLELEGAYLENASGVWSMFKNKPLTVLQLETECCTYTCELFKGGKPALCSIRFFDEPPEDLLWPYSRLENELPETIVADFVTKYWNRTIQ